MFQTIGQSRSCDVCDDADCHVLDLICEGYDSCITDAYIVFIVCIIKSHIQNRILMSLLDTFRKFYQITKINFLNLTGYRLIKVAFFVWYNKAGGISTKQRNVNSNINDFIQVLYTSTQQYFRPISWSHSSKTDLSTLEHSRTLISQLTFVRNMRTRG